MRAPPELSGVAFTADLVHLIAASVWLGGIAVIAIAWLPRLPELGAAGRRRIVEVVLPRFGAGALPAFFTLVVAGGLNAATELDRRRPCGAPAMDVSCWSRRRWSRVVALLSYRHALRLRPRLLASREFDSRLERRHWRLLAAEPIVSAGIVVAAALLLAYAPPIDLSRTVASAAVPAGAARDASAEGSQLSVAGEAGPYIVNALVTRDTHRGERRGQHAHGAPAAGSPPGTDPGSRAYRSVRRWLHPVRAGRVTGDAWRRRHVAGWRVSRVAADQVRAGRER